MLRGMFIRRTLIKLAFAAIASWVAGRVSAVAARSDRAPVQSIAEALAGLCSDLRCVPEIGTSCLMALGASERAEAELTRSIIGGLPPTDREGVSQTTLWRALAERSREDFGDGNVVAVDGWILSVTETRLYALSALLTARRPALA